MCLALIAIVPCLLSYIQVEDLLFSGNERFIIPFNFHSRFHSELVTLDLL